MFFPPQYYSEVHLGWFHQDCIQVLLIPVAKRAFLPSFTEEIDDFMLCMTVK